MEISQPTLSTPVPSPRLQGCVPQKGKGCTNYPQLTWFHWPQSLLCIALHLPGTGYCHLLLLGCLHFPCKTDLGFEFLLNTWNPQASKVVETQLAFLGPICTSPCSQKPPLPVGSFLGQVCTVSQRSILILSANLDLCLPVGFFISVSLRYIQ